MTARIERNLSYLQVVIPKFSDHDQGRLSHLVNDSDETLGRPAAGDRFDLLPVARGEQPAEPLQGGDARGAGPMRRVLEGIGDAEQEVGDGHLPARRLRQVGNRQREGAAGGDQELFQIG